MKLGKTELCTGISVFYMHDCTSGTIVFRFNFTLHKFRPSKLVILPNLEFTMTPLNCVLREINQDIGFRLVLSSPTDEKLKGAKIKLKERNISLYTVFNGLEKYIINYKLVNVGSTYI